MKQEFTKAAGSQITLLQYDQALCPIHQASLRRAMQRAELSGAKWGDLIADFIMDIDYKGISLIYTPPFMDNILPLSDRRWFNLFQSEGYVNAKGNRRISYQVELIRLLDGALKHKGDSEYTLASQIWVEQQHWIT